MKKRKTLYDELLSFLLDWENQKTDPDLEDDQRLTATEFCKNYAEYLTTELSDYDYTRDLAIKIMDYVWYDYMGMTDDVEEYNFHMQDTIHRIINEHCGVDENTFVKDGASGKEE